jgi:CBS-domain-containing membrane protein
MAAMKAMQGYIDITPADFKEVYRVAYALARKRMLSARKAAEIMTSPVLTLPADADLIATATLLAENGISGAPVIDGAGRVVGVVSEKDLAQDDRPYPKLTRGRCGRNPLVLGRQLSGHRRRGAGSRSL